MRVTRRAERGLGWREPSILPRIAGLELLKELFSLGIDHRRHSGESRNPFSSGITMLRLFISPSLAGTNQKRKTKAKQMDSGFRRNDEQSRTAFQGKSATSEGAFAPLAKAFSTDPFLRHLTDHS